MSDVNEPNVNSADNAREVPGEEPFGVEAIRREASARFQIDAEIGSEAALREAMDPATRSLAEALRLSFRVLQIVIVILVVLFVLSGAKIIGQGETGVATRWGRVLKASDGDAALSEGLKLNWPYPAGEFILFQGENRQVSVTRDFWPTDETISLTDAMARVDLSASTINPAAVGALLTRGGDLAHLQMRGEFIVDDVERFVESVRVSSQSGIRDVIDADRLVRLAMQRAAVHAASSLSYADLKAQTESKTTNPIRVSAQQLLDSIDCGITLSQVDVRAVILPVAIEKFEADFQAARSRAADQLESARSAARDMLNSIAGSTTVRQNNRDEQVPRAELLIPLIEQYQEAHQFGETARADAMLSQIHASLADPATFGEVAEIISNAQAYRSHVDSTLGAAARRFEGIRKIYRQQPEVVVTRYWYDAFRTVLTQPDVEVFWVPEDLREFRVSIERLDEINQQRREQRLKSRERESMETLRGQVGQRPMTTRSIETGHRQLDVEGGRIRTGGSNR